jgi:hypothetical protein
MQSILKPALVKLIPETINLSPEEICLPYQLFLTVYSCIEGKALEQAWSETNLEKSIVLPENRQYKSCKGGEALRNHV